MSCQEINSDVDQMNVNFDSFSILTALTIHWDSGRAGELLGQTLQEKERGAFTDEKLLNNRLFD